MTDWGQKFPLEIWDNVLNYLLPKMGNLMPIDLRASLSVESFQSAQAQFPEDSTAANNFVSHPPLSNP